MKNIFLMTSLLLTTFSASYAGDYQRQNVQKNQGSVTGQSKQTPVRVDGGHGTGYRSYNGRTGNNR